MMPGFSLNWRRTSSTTAPAGAAHSRHGNAAEQIRQQTAEQQTGDDIGVGQREQGVHRDAIEDTTPPRIGREELQVSV
jgi:hypothetical protein